MWMEFGEPQVGEVFENMKEAKRQFSYACRRLKRQEHLLRNEKMAEAISQNRSRDFFKKVEKVSGCKHDPPTIDGVRDMNSIAELLKNTYAGLYNSNPSEQANIKKIEDFITNQVPLSNYKDRIVTEEDVTEAVSILKQGKSDGDKGLLSDNIIHGSKVLFTLIALLMSTSRKHGHMPEELLMASITSIPKNKCGNICSSDNYRGIALSSAISKINDIIILNKYQNILSTSDMQFAFKKKHGTTMCILVVKEVAKYYLKKGSEVYTCAIDASKAFDRVRRDKLFILLIEKGLPAFIVRILFDGYKR